MSELLLVERRGPALVLTLNRPEKRNALSQALAAELLKQVAVASDDAGVRGIIIQGAGATFCAGADLDERAAATPEKKWALSRGLLQLNRLILNSPKIVYASIGGWCLGGGLELALACDFRVASSDAKFGWPELKLGAYPGAGAAVLLPRLIGFQAAKQMLLDTRNLTAAEARALGLLDELAADRHPTDACLEFVESLTRIAPLAQAAVKASVRDTFGMGLEKAFQLDGNYRQPLEATADYQEGISAFREKREPVFKGH